MNGTDRGMIKWAPYQSLVEQATSLARMKHKKSKIEKPLISNERASEINEILSNYNHETVTIRYWVDGVIYSYQGTIDKIDVFEKRVEAGGKKISFSSFVQIISK